MPTLLLIEGLRFYFYSNEGEEPPHVHVSKGRAAAKLWLRPVRLVYSNGFSPAEQRRMRELTFEYQIRFVELWNEHFSR
jgi:hypothetical protein